MQFRGLAILCASCLSACDVPPLVFHPHDAAVDPPVDVPDGMPPEPMFSLQAYLKASNTGAGDRFGQGVALSADGSTVAVGAFLEASRGANPDDNSAQDAGAVYVFARTGSGWAQQKYIKAANAGPDDWFGWSVALSADGSMLAVGAPSEDSKSTGLTGDPNDNSAPAAGAVYIFTRTGTEWSQQAYLKASNTDAADQFGATVALSADGSVLAVGAITERGNGTSQSNNDAPDAGAVYVFTRTGAAWSGPVYVKPPTVVAFDRFGSSLALSHDGATLAVGIQRPASFGKAYVFARSGATWIEQFKPEAAGPNSGFGTGVALAGDGSLLAVGAARENSPTTGAGAVYLYTRTDGTWSTLPARLTAANAGEDDGFGDTVALSAAGTLLAVGATREDSSAIGVGGDGSDDSASDAGAVYVFSRDAAWTQRAYVKASNTGAGDGFGQSLVLSTDGSTLVVGASFEDSNATGVNSNADNDSSSNAGAVYVFH
jgi:trimeric autotransporter adhesin